MTDSVRVFMLPRNSALWMMVALTVTLIPLLIKMPIWLSLIWLGVLYWRFNIFSGQWSQPSTLNKLSLMCACVLALYVTFGRITGLEPMVALLICALLLKVLEMQRLRDALLVIYLGLFFVGVQFLFSQTLMANLYGVLCLSLIVTALLSIYQPQGHDKPRRTMMLSVRLLIHTLPLAVLLFLVVPRIDALWSVPSAKHTAKTGVSDSMSPGHFSTLSRSGGVAFRATFDGPVPKQSELYWRGLVFSFFDGETWRSSAEGDSQGGQPLSESSNRQPWLNHAIPFNKPTRYQVIMEPTGRPWLYSLALPVEYQAGGEDVLIDRNYNLRVKGEVTNRTVYEVSSHLDHIMEPQSLMPLRKSRELRLPQGFNPLTRARAQEWFADSAEPRVYIDRVLDFFNQRFSYTLEPPRLGRNSVDDFLFTTQQGFCEHFASAFVVMMRAAGVPARVVAGYQGGEYNDIENYVLVHQYDAHAWAEVWLADEGWIRIDPTAVVAPERILSSLGDTQTELVEGALSLGRYRDIPLLNTMRLQWDAINYRWYKTVMGFDQESQQQLFAGWFNGITALKMVLFVLGCGGGMIALISLHFWWQARPLPRSQIAQSYQEFEGLLAAKQIHRLHSEAPGAFSNRVAQEYPSLARAVNNYTILYIQCQYGSREFKATESRSALKLLKKQLKILA